MEKHIGIEERYPDYTFDDESYAECISSYTLEFTEEEVLMIEQAIANYDKIQQLIESKIQEQEQN